MAANLADHVPIRAVKTISGNQPQIVAYKEKAGQTFLGGTPCQLTAGVLLAWDGVTITNGILGVVLNDGANLATDGAGAPGAFGSVGAPGASVTFGKVLNQTSAVNIPHGAPMVDGRNLSQIANNDTIYEAQVDNNTGANFTLLAADIGATFGMTKDATGHWYVDRAKTGASAVAVILAANPNDGLIANARVYFKFLDAVFQLQS